MADIATNPSRAGKPYPITDPVQFEVLGVVTGEENHIDQTCLVAEHFSITMSTEAAQRVTETLLVTTDDPFELSDRHLVLVPGEADGLVLIALNDRTRQIIISSDCVEAA